MANKIILLNGPSGSGKSTLAKSLRDLIFQRRNERYEIVSIDDFLKMTADSPIYEDDVFEISGKMCDEIAKTSKTRGVIIDHVITSRRIFEQLTEAVDLAVQVTCPLETLKKRERNRGDRCVGSAEASYMYLYPREGYDLTVDTGDMSASECAEAIFYKIFQNKS